MPVDPATPSTTPTPVGTDRDGASPRRISSELAVVGVLALVGAVVPVVVAWHFGALGIPRNDDWSYVLTAFEFADHGRFVGTNWASMSLIGQVLLSTPLLWVFGDRITALQLGVAALGVGGLYATYDLARHVLTLRRALFVALLVAVGPLWQLLAASYMTDVPSYALIMICLALGARALRGPTVHLGLVVGSLAVGLLAFSVREYALVAAIAVALTAIGQARRNGDRRTRLVLLGGFGALIVLAGAVYLWRRGVPRMLELEPSAPTTKSITLAQHVVRQYAILAGFLVAPAVLLADPVGTVLAAWRRARVTTVVVGVGVVLVLGRELVRHFGSGLLLGAGNYVMPNGAFGTVTLDGSRADLFPTALLGAFALVGILAVAVVACSVIPALYDALRRIRGRDGSGPHTRPVVCMVVLAALGFSAAFAVPVALDLPAFDRYLLPIVPLVAILVLRSGARRPASRPRRLVATTALVVVGAFGLVTAMNAASFDGAKWEVARAAATAAGTDAAGVDGGLEWNYFHDGLPEDPRTPCVKVTVQDDAPDPETALVRPRSVWGPTGRQGWITATRVRDDC